MRSAPLLACLPSSTQRCRFGGTPSYSLLDQTSLPWGLYDNLHVCFTAGQHRLSTWWEDAGRLSLWCPKVGADDEAAAAAEEAA
ncbi:MAG: hypothetical protein M1298_04010 [Chloroflexi bacterium]|nr:hypothetical protein [Chloroflexota bacterium]